MITPAESAVLEESEYVWLATSLLPFALGNHSCLRYPTVHERGFSADCSGGFGSATGVLSFPAGCWQDGGGGFHDRSYRSRLLKLRQADAKGDVDGNT